MKVGRASSVAAALSRAGRNSRRARPWFAVLSVMLAAFAVAGLIQLRIDTTLRSFLPAGESAYKSLEQRSRTFGDDPIVVLVESDDAQKLLRDEASLLGLLRLEGELARVRDVSSVYGPATTLNQIARTAQNVLAEISGRRDAIEQQALIKARRDGKGDAETRRSVDAALAKFDRRYGALLVQGLPAGLPTLKNPSFVAAVLYDENQKIRSQWRFVVPNDHAVALLVRPRADLDQATTQRLVDEVRTTVKGADLSADRITVSGVPVVTAGLSTRAREEAPTLGLIAVGVVGLVFFLAPWGRRRARLIPLGCALCGAALTLSLFGWADRPVSLGVVAFLPILLGVGSDFPYYLLAHGQQRRVVVAAVAAAVGFGSLALSPLPFVRELGFALAVGLAATVGAACLARVLGAGRRTPEMVEREVIASEDPAARRGTWSFLLVAGVVLASVGWVALPSLSFEGRPDRLASGLAELDDAQHVEDVLGSSGEIGVLLRGDGAYSAAGLAWARKAEQEIVLKLGADVRPVVSPTSLFGFLGDAPSPAQADAGLQLMPSYLTSAVIANDRASMMLTFGVQLDDLQRQGQLVNDLEDVLPPPPDGFTADVVGLPVVVSRGIDLASSGRILLNLVGAALAGLVVAAGLGTRQGAVVISTIVLSTGWTLALTWALVGTLSPLTVAVGALATATGCEFATMLSSPTGKGRRGPFAVGTACVAGVAGYLTLAVSELSLLREFGLLLAASVASSFLAALLVTRFPLVRTGRDVDEMSESGAPESERVEVLA